MESHEPDLLDEIHDQEKVLEIQEDYTRIDFDAATRTLLDFAVKLTLDIRGMEKTDIESLRANGFSDDDILDAVHLISYFNFVNRVLDALGAEPEESMRYGKEECLFQGVNESLPYDDGECSPHGTD
jgi:uncharacterized peroxidase-related enzyme